MVGSWISKLIYKRVSFGLGEQALSGEWVARTCSFRTGLPSFSLWGKKLLSCDIFGQGPAKDKNLWKVFCSQNAEAFPSQSYHVLVCCKQAGRSRHIFMRHLGYHFGLKELRPCWEPPRQALGKTPQRSCLGPQGQSQEKALGWTPQGWDQLGWVRALSLCGSTYILCD